MDVLLCSSELRRELYQKGASRYCFFAAAASVASFSAFADIGGL
jgi:hypothetical protein